MQPGMPARGRATWPSGDDYTFFSLLVIVFGLVFFGYMAWTLHHAEIARGFAWLAHWHIAAISGFTEEYDSLDAQLLSADYGRVTLNPTASLDLLDAFGSRQAATWASGQHARQGSREADAQGGD